jgi:hypothetical protein
VAVVAGGEALVVLHRIPPLEVAPADLCAAAGESAVLSAADHAL